MEPIQDLTATRLLLRRGIEAGHWTLEDLDTPSYGWRENAKRFRVHHPNYNQHQYRNPLRYPEQPETVQRSEPRDFTPPPGTTPANSPNLPVTLEQPPQPDGITLISNDFAHFDPDSLDF